jgi:prevent-host-death family protein
MGEIGVRDLRNDTSGVLQRVEQGERIRVTVSGRPVADIIPLPQRRRYLAWEELVSDAGDIRADADLAHELRELTPETTDDEPLA